MQETVMSIKPKWAEQIYKGEKHWEFRKKPPRLNTRILLYESAPVSKLTGVVLFNFSLSGIPSEVWQQLTQVAYYSTFSLGVASLAELEEYAGSKDRIITALRVLVVHKFSKPYALSVRPPQNWGLVDVPQIDFED